MTARTSQTVVVGRMRPGSGLGMTPLAAMDDAESPSFILDLLRAQRAPDGTGIAVLRSTSIAWESGMAIGEPLERLGWHAADPVALAIPTPALAGEAVIVRQELPLEREAGTASARDTREQALDARWRARERLRETARHFFGCAVEQITALAEDVRDIRADPLDGSVHTTVTALVQGPGSDAPPAGPVDLPHAQLVLLPLVLGELLRDLPASLGAEPLTEPAAGLLLFEERRLTYALWRTGALTILRSFPFGADHLTGHLVRLLACSPREAATLLARADSGALSADAQRILSKALRPLLPLFGGMWRLLEEALRDQTRPMRVLVAGYWPAILLRLLSRTAFRPRCLPPTAAVQTLAPVGPLEGVPGGALLLQLADAVSRQGVGARAGRAVPDAARVAGGPDMVARRAR